MGVAKDLLEAEAKEKVEERKKYMEENCPPLDMPHSKEELMVNTHITFSNTDHLYCSA